MLKKRLFKAIPLYMYIPCVLKAPLLVLKKIKSTHYLEPF